jgi:hypothetical protein
MALTAYQHELQCLVSSNNTFEYQAFMELEGQDDPQQLL